MSVGNKNAIEVDGTNDEGQFSKYIFLRKFTFQTKLLDSFFSFSSVQNFVEFVSSTFPSLSHCSFFSNTIGGARIAASDDRKLVS